MDPSCVLPLTLKDDIVLSSPPCLRAVLPGRLMRASPQRSVYSARQTGHVLIRDSIESFACA